MDPIKIDITINKNILILVGITIAIVMSYFAFAVVNSNLPWHPLQQISKSSTDLTSIDENGDGIIDHTNANLTEITTNGAVTPNSIAVGGLTTTGSVNIGGSLNVGGDAVFKGSIEKNNTINLYCWHGLSRHRLTWLGKPITLENLGKMIVNGKGKAELASIWYYNSTLGVWESYTPGRPFNPPQIINPGDTVLIIMDEKSNCNGDYKRVQLPAISNQNIWESDEQFYRLEVNHELEVYGKIHAYTYGDRSGDIIADGKVSGSQICIKNDCISSWQSQSNADSTITVLTVESGNDVLSDSCSGIYKGGFCKDGYFYKDITFPQPFDNPPHVIVTPEEVNVDGGCIGGATDKVYAGVSHITKTGFRLWCSGSPVKGSCGDYEGSSTRAKCSWLAIGESTQHYKPHIKIITASKSYGMSSWEYIKDPDDGSVLTSSNAFCAVTGWDDDTIKPLQGKYECQVKLNNNGQWMYLIPTAAGDANCAVSCIEFK